MTEEAQMVDEDQAQGRVADLYRDIRRSMGVSVVGDVLRAFAAYPSFMEAVWWEFKPMIGGESFEGLADRLRAHATACARQQFYVPDHTAALRAGGMETSEIDRLRDTLEIFYQTDPRLLVITSALQESLIRGRVGQLTSGDVRRRVENAVLRPVALNLVSSRDLSPTVKQVLDEIHSTLGLPTLLSEWRALAQWPDYLQLAWSDLKPQMRSAPFRRLLKELDGIAAAGVRELPRPIMVDSATIRAAGVRQSELTRVQQLCALFANTMPVLVATIALFRVGLNTMLEHQLLELEANA